MLRLHVRHTTRYLYHRPVQFGRHRLVLRPREGHDLRLESFDLSIAPAHALTWVRDVFGNSIALVDFLDAATELEIVNEHVLTRIEPFPERRLHEPWRVKWPVAYEAMDATLADAYLVPTHPDDAAALREWLAAKLEPVTDDAEGTMLRLCEIVKREIVYRRRPEKGVQTPAQTLSLGSGSCRDMATLLMDCSRLAGVAARFASGYLHGSASIAGRASMHAWAEVFLPGLGWRGLDPTLGRAVSLQHVPVGLSHHPRGVMPVSGTFDGTGADFVEMQVQVHTEELPPLGGPDLVSPLGAAARGKRLITIILNAGSGHDDKAEVRARICTALQSTGREFEIRETGSADEVQQIATEVVNAASAAPRILVAAGGDGTINCVAATIVGSGLPVGRVILGVLPMGTFNYFARDLGIPLDPAAAAAALAGGYVRRVHTATINGHLFLNNASFGLYRHLLEEREELKQRWGRYKVVAAISAVRSLWKHRHVYGVRLQIDGSEERTLHTPMLFFGINSLQLEKLDLEVAQCTHAGLVAVVALRPMSPWRILGTALRGALQGLREASNLRCHCAARVQVDLPGARHAKVAVDGESIACDLPLRVETRRESLAVLVPREPAERR